MFKKLLRLIFPRPSKTPYSKTIRLNGDLYVISSLNQFVTTTNSDYTVLIQGSGVIDITRNGSHYACLKGKTIIEKIGLKKKSSFSLPDRTPSKSFNQSHSSSNYRSNDSDPLTDALIIESISTSHRSSHHHDTSSYDGGSSSDSGSSYSGGGGCD